MSDIVRSFARRLIASALFCSLTLAVVVVGGWNGGVAAATLERSTVAVTTAAGGRFTFKVEVAKTESEQARGLMYRERLADDAGMLFPYDSPRQTAFWMRNTLIPLDIIFIGADGRIARIHPMATPKSEATIASGGLVIAVLEINGGLSARLGLREGDQVGSPVLDRR